MREAFHTDFLTAYGDGDMFLYISYFAARGCNGRQIDRRLTTPKNAGISRALALLGNAMTHAVINVEWHKTVFYTLLHTLPPSLSLSFSLRVGAQL